jgi:hypothetical protein
LREVKRALALLVPLSLVFAACGGDDDATSATGTAVTVPANASDGPADAATDDATDSGNDTSPPPDGGDSSTYCEVARQFAETSDELDESIDPFDFSADSFRETFDMVVESLGEIRRVTPDEIRADVDAVADAFGRLRAELEAVDYNFFAVDIEAFERLGDDLEAATDRIETYNERVCGIAPSDDMGDLGDLGDFDLGDLEDFDLDSLGEFGDIVRQELTAGFMADGYTRAEAECLAEAVFEFDFTDQPGEMTDPFTRCGVDPSR